MTGNDGNVYPTVKIGNQVWMAKNSRETKWRDPWPTTSLYNKYAIDNVKNIAPSGWHIPSVAEFETLKSTVGVNPGQKLKAVGSDGWFAGNDGTDTTGFAARGSGLRFGVEAGSYFDNVRTAVVYHVSDTYDSTDGGLTWRSGYGTMMRDNTFARWSSGSLLNGSSLGCSVRLIKDDSNNPTGTMTGNDGKVYSAETIGSQVWMSEDLNETLYRDLTSIPEVTNQTSWDNNTTGARCYYNNLNKGLIEDGFHIYNATWKAPGLVAYNDDIIMV
jgi:uncharacterized protein (TIGR02145 family)